MVIIGVAKNPNIKENIYGKCSNNAKARYNR